MVRVLLVLTFFFSSFCARAHDLWLIPPDQAAVNKSITIRVNSGTEFPVSEAAPKVDKFVRRLVVTPAGKESACAAADADGPSGVMTFTPSTPGVHVIGVVTPPRVLELPADDFNLYLVTDGLPHVYSVRHKEGSLRKDAKERYSKSPKCLLKVGDGPGDVSRPMGLPLEIVPLKDPFRIAPGEALPVRVLFNQQPLPDANLGWDIPGDGPAFSGTVRTNVKGEALIPIAQAGLMTIRLTHMTQPKVADYEWESFWTSLTWHAP